LVQSDSGNNLNACGLPTKLYWPHCFVNGGADGGPVQFPDPPLVMDPHDQGHLFLASNTVWEKMGTNSWNALTGKNLTFGTHPAGFACNPFCPDYISAMAVRDDTNEIFTGTAYGRLWRGNFNGPPWGFKDMTSSFPRPTNATKNPALPWISDIVINPNDASEVWVSVQGNGTGGVWHTTDAGDDTPVWTNVTGNLGSSPVSAIVLGGNALYAAIPGGVEVCGTCQGTAAAGSWQAVGTGLPNTWIGDLSYTGHDIIAWTFGRGAWTVSL
jgi:hypothetical protein